MYILGSIKAYEIEIKNLKGSYYGLASVTCSLAGTGDNDIDAKLNIFHNGELVKKFTNSKRLILMYC